MSNSPFVIIRGAPGVGKSTVADILKEHFLNGVCIEVDMLRLMVHSNCWDNVGQHLAAIKLAAQVGQHYAACGYVPVIIVDTLSFGTIQLLSNELRPFVPRIYSLVAADDTIAERIQQRKGHGYHDWRRSIVINHHIIENPADLEVTIDTTTMASIHVALDIVEHERSLGGTE